MLLCPLLLFVKLRDTQFHLVTHVEHIARHVLIIVYHYFCHGPYSFPAEDLSGCISLLLYGFIADLCRTCIFTHCVILYPWLASNSHLRRRLCGPSSKKVWRQGWERGVICFLSFLESGFFRPLPTGSIGLDHLLSQLAKGIKADNLASYLARVSSESCMTEEKEVRNKIFIRRKIDTD